MSMEGINRSDGCSYKHSQIIPRLAMKDPRSQSSLIPSIFVLVIVGFLLFLWIAISDILRVSAIEDLKLETGQYQQCDITAALRRECDINAALERHRPSFRVVVP